MHHIVTGLLTINTAHRERERDIMGNVSSDSFNTPFQAAQFHDARSNCIEPALTSGSCPGKKKNLNKSKKAKTEKLLNSREQQQKHNDGLLNLQSTRGNFSTPLITYPSVMLLC